MANEFWDSFNSGYGVARDLRQRGALAKMKRDPEGGLNALMLVNPELAGQMQDRQQRSKLYDQQLQSFEHEQAGWRRNDDIDAGRVRASSHVTRGDSKGAMGELDPRDMEGLQSLQAWAIAADDRQLEQARNEAQRMAGLIDSVAGVSTDPRVRYAAAMQLAAQGGFSSDDVRHWTADMFTDQSLRMHSIQGMGYEKVLDNERTRRALDLEQQRINLRR